MIYAAIGIFCLAVLMIGGRPMGGKEGLGVSTTQASEQASLLVLVKPQPDAPLLITEPIVADSADPQMPTVQFKITNTTKKRIMAYAIRHDAALSNSSFPGTIATNFPDRNRAFQAGASAQLEITGIRYGELPISLTLSVDFVEFVDGKRWGPDTFKHGEVIDGLRAGAEMMKEAMLKALEVESPEAFSRSLDSINVEPDQPNLHSSEWSKGFRSGVNWMRERVRRKGKDLIEIRRELRQSID